MWIIWNVFTNSITTNIKFVWNNLCEKAPNEPHVCYIWPRHRTGSTFGLPDSIWPLGLYTRPLPVSPLPDWPIVLVYHKENYNTTQGLFLCILAKTQSPQNAKTQFDNWKTQFENWKTPKCCKLYANYLRSLLNLIKIHENFVKYWKL